MLATPIVGCALGALAAAPRIDPPNVVVILVDDVGTDFLAPFDARNPYRQDLPYEHGAVGGGTAPGNGPGTSNLYVHAPNLEALAAEGVTFLDAYACPTCSPTRAALLTGCAPLRTGVGEILLAEHLGTLREFGDPGFDRQTLPELVRQAGYADKIVGKWHLGMPSLDFGAPESSACNLGWATIPERGGFSEWACVFNGLDNPPQSAAGGYYDFYLCSDTTSHAEVLAEGHVVGQYATTVQLGLALEWCNAQTAPFLCVLTPNAAHSPWDDLPPADRVATSEYMTAEANAFNRYLATLEAFDAELGVFMAGLDPQKKADTVFFLMGDNGTPEVVLEHARGGALIGGAQGSELDLGETYDLLLGGAATGDGRFKHTVYEKGVRVPLIVAGAGVVDPGRESTALVQVEDLFPTIAELVGLPAGDVDGLSFAPILRAEIDDAEHARDFVWSERFFPNGPAGVATPLAERRVAGSLRIADVGRFKLIRTLPDGGEQLYRLEDADGEPLDPWETAPLPLGEGQAWHAEHLLVASRVDAMLALGDAVAAAVETSVYCDAQANSTGAPSEIVSHGTLSVAADEFALVVSDLPPGQFGIVFFGHATTAELVGGGLLCVAPPFVRLDPVPTPGHGDLFVPLDLDALFAPDETVHMQFWYRDPLGATGGFNFSQAVTATFAQ